MFGFVGDAQVFSGVGGRVSIMEVCDCKTHLYIWKFFVRNSNLLFWYCSILTM